MKILFVYPDINRWIQREIATYELKTCNGVLKLKALPRWILLSNIYNRKLLIESLIVSDKTFSRILKSINKLIPGDWLKTFVYLSCLATPRRVLRKSIGGFYRMEHIYEVLNEFNKHYVGKFSILEFGVADGYSFTKKLYATHYLKMTDKVIVHGFDTFKGLPKVTNSAEQRLLGQELWKEGYLRGDMKNWRITVAESTIISNYIRGCLKIPLLMSFWKLWKSICQFSFG